MSDDIVFPHHSYLHDTAEGRYELIPSAMAGAVQEPGRRDVGDVPSLLRAANVSQIILVHGTFAGNDVIGLMREFARFSPGAAGVLKRFVKRLFDQVAGELGNYTQSYAERLSHLVNVDGRSHIAVTPFHWSGENHHLGRAGGAMALLDSLQSQAWDPGQRVLIWGHSHGGNLLALMTGILGADAAARDAFFRATLPHYRDPIMRRLDLPFWERVRDRLEANAGKGPLPHFDVATFGTPLRYRWNIGVCENLLHFVHHRPLKADVSTRASVPTTIREVASAAGGDYIQQLGIGGTDFLHPFYAWRSWWVERRLRRLLAPGIRRRDLPRNLQQGQRVSLDGETLLVDYPKTPERWRRKVAGHALYTRHEWLPFHLREVATRFYS